MENNKTMEKRPKQQQNNGNTMGIFEQRPNNNKTMEKQQQQSTDCC